MTPQFQTPILFLIFNRLDTTSQVFDAIRARRPKFLYVAADGPRENRVGEFERCQQTRALIDSVDWDCEVKTLFRDKNLGCGRAVSSAITWFFENVSEGIILEDDCVPHPDFFRYTEELLAKYRNDSQVMMISGDNFLLEKYKCEDSYYFSRYHFIWGWATWKRAWDCYSFKLDTWPETKLTQKFKPMFSRSEMQYWVKIFDQTHLGKIDTWDYQWLYTMLTHGGLSICPSVNLIKNVGFCGEATHTSVIVPVSALGVAPIEFPLRHPPRIAQNVKADKVAYRNFFRNDLFVKRVESLILQFKQFRKMTDLEIQAEQTRLKKKTLKSRLKIFAFTCARAISK